MTQTPTQLYEKNGASIYRESFRIIREESDLAAYSPAMERVAVRMIHACGQTDLPHLIQHSPGAAEAGIAALAAGAPILCDSTMVAQGVTRTRLPAANEVLCTLTDPRTTALALALGTTRSAAALNLWKPHLAGSIVCIGNAPTALFHLLELLEQGAPCPALIVGIPVGFVGAAESKQALAEHPLTLPFLTVTGRRGGSAIAAAAINALASEQE